jgi:hypothetical protein
MLYVEVANEQTWLRTPLVTPAKGRRGNMGLELQAGDEDESKLVGSRFRHLAENEAGLQYSTRKG